MSREEKKGLLPPSAESAEATVYTNSFVRFFSDWLAAWPYRNFDIHDVCERGDYEALRQFVTTHRDPKWLKEMVNREDSSGPPLRCLLNLGDTTKRSHLACAQLLLELGAKANAVEPGRLKITLLNTAWYYSIPPMAALLVKYGADIDNARSFRGELFKEMNPERAAEIKRLSKSKTELNFISEMETPSDVDSSESDEAYFDKKNQ